MADLEVHVKCVQTVNHGVWCCEMVLDRHPTSRGQAPNSEVDLLLPPVHWHSAPCLDEDIQVNFGCFVFFKDVHELRPEIDRHTKA